MAAWSGDVGASPSLDATLSASAFGGGTRQSLGLVGRGVCDLGGCGGAGVLVAGGFDFGRDAATAFDFTLYFRSGHVNIRTVVR